MNNYTHIFHGTAFSSESPKKVTILKDYLFFIDTNGMIKKWSDRNKPNIPPC